MSNQSAISSALADLQDMLIAGVDSEQAISELAAEYNLKVEVLQARASRDGGVLDSAARLKREALLTFLMQAYANEGHLFSIVKLSFQDWYEREFGHNLDTQDVAFSDRLHADAVKLGQNRFHQLTLMQLSGYRAEYDA